MSELRANSIVRKCALGAALVLACSVVCAPAPAARATIQDDRCIYPDVEYPMPCDDDGD